MAIEEEQVYPELQRIDSEIAEEAETEHGLTAADWPRCGHWWVSPASALPWPWSRAGSRTTSRTKRMEAFPKLREALGLADSESQTKDEV